MDSNEIFAWSQYRARLSDVSLWIEKADQLVDAAHLLEPSIIAFWDKARAQYPRDGSSKQESESNSTHYPFLQDIFFMLAAYALENYLKAAILSQPGHRSTIAEAKQPEEAKGHQLSLLARHAGFQLNESKMDKLFLQKLEEHSTWRGRYPAPLLYRKLVTSYMIDGRNYFSAFLAPTEIPQINDLIDRVSTYVKSTVLPNMP